MGFESIIIISKLVIWGRGWRKVCLSVPVSCPGLSLSLKTKTVSTLHWVFLFIISAGYESTASNMLSALPLS